MLCRCRPHGMLESVGTHHHGEPHLYSPCTLKVRGDERMTSVHVPLPKRLRERGVSNVVVSANIRLNIY